MMAAFIGFVDVFAGLVMLWSALRITTAAGFRTIQARWALFRRVVYLLTSFALFGLGVGRFEGDFPITSTSQAIYQLMLLLGIVVFPLLRAFGWITQDQFKSVDGTYERSAGRR